MRRVFTAFAFEIHTALFTFEDLNMSILCFDSRDLIGIGGSGSSLTNSARTKEKEWENYKAQQEQEKSSASGAGDQLLDFDF